MTKEVRKIMAYGHSLKKSFEILSQRIEVPEDIARKAKVLDMLMPTLKVLPLNSKMKMQMGALKSAEEIFEFARGVAYDSLRERN